MTDILHWLTTTWWGGIVTVELAHVGICLIIIYIWPARARD